MTVLQPGKPGVAASLGRAPVVGVVRTASQEEGRRQALTLLSSGLELVEITFTVPGALEVVAELRGHRSDGGPPWIGMGTVTSEERVAQAVACGAEFLVTPVATAGVLQAAGATGLYVIAGALTPTEIVTAWELGADLIKVYPLPPVGGPAYLSTIRQPLGEIRMLAAGGFGVDEIPAYRRAGACAFGLGAPLLGVGNGETSQTVARALRLARGEEAR